MATESESRKSGDSNTSWTFSGFDDSALRVFGAARAEAQRLQHHSIFAEHLLLALSSTTDLLEQNGLDPKAVRNAVEKRLTLGTTILPADKISFGPRAKYILGLALFEARQARHPAVSQEHLLLGLLQDDGGNATELLQQMGLNPDDFRNKVAQMREAYGKMRLEVEASLGVEIDKNQSNKLR